MIIVTGSVLAREGTLDAVLAVSVAHVRRSRTEPGCLLHSVHQDVEEPLRVVFLEHWRDAEALRAHFAVPASLEFVAEVTELAAEPPAIQIYEAEPARL
jgi:quinol monooxygenase YgiN